MDVGAVKAPTIRRSQTCKRSRQSVSTSPSRFFKSTELTRLREGKRLPPENQPISTDTICSALAAAAAQNDLPTDFFTRLIWQESRFDPAAVSRAGAQGVAQFMPATANWRGLSNPFDPLEAIAESAKLDTPQPKLDKLDA